MKTRIISLVTAVLVLWQCSPEVSPLHHTAPVVNFPLEAQNITAKVGEPVSFKANIVSGDRLSKAWYVDSVLESSDEEFTYTFFKPGKYEVSFKASNGAGSVEKSYSVSVSDILEMHLSVEDSTVVTRVEQSFLKLYAIVDNGSDVVHSWSVDGEKLSDKAFFGTFFLKDTQSHEISYTGSNGAGSFSKKFTVNVNERPLTIQFSEEAATLSSKIGATLTLTAKVLFGGTGVVHKWYMDSKLVSESTTMSYKFTAAGTVVLRYEGKNAKGEIVERSWTVNVAARDEAIFEDFENGAYTCFKQGTLSVVDNPHPSGLNKSSKVLKVSAPGTGSTSGYFTMINSEIAKKGIDITKYRGLKVLVWMDKGKYWPVMDYKGRGKVLPNDGKPEFTGEWEVLEYSIDFSTNQQLQPRPFQILDGNGKPKNIPGGAVTETNPRVVYFDEFTLFE